MRGLFFLGIISSKVIFAFFSRNMREEIGGNDWRENYVSHVLSELSKEKVNDTREQNLTENLNFLLNLRFKIFYHFS